MRISARPKGVLERVVVGILTTALLIGPFAPLGSARPVCRMGDQYNGPAWQFQAGPTFSAGPQEITDYAVAAIVDNLYATNGKAVAKSVDGGCSWDEIFVLPVAPDASVQVTQHEGTIVDVKPGFANQVLLAVSQAQPRLRTHVLISTNGTTFKEASGFETHIGSPMEIAVTNFDPERAYLLTSFDEQENESLPARTGDLQTLWASDNGGQSWRVAREWGGDRSVAVPGVPSTPADEEGYEAAHVITGANANDVWLYGPNGVARSTDGGPNLDLNFAVQDIPVNDVSVYPAGKGVRAVIAEASTSLLHISTNGGQTWAVVDANQAGGTGIVESVAPLEGLKPGLFAVSSENGVYTTDGYRFEEESAVGQPPMYDISSYAYKDSVHEMAAIFGRTPQGIWRFFDQIPPPPVAPEEILTTASDLVDYDPPPVDGFLQPDKTRLVLDKGEIGNVDYNLDLEAAPSPVDVQFLIDVSQSMGEEITGVRSSMGEIVKQLTDYGVDAWFAVGEYRSYTDTPPYWPLVQNVTPPNYNNVINGALNRLVARGGGDETQAAALVQLATGQGQQGPGTAFIEKGLQTRWRPGALRVVIHVTDEEISQGEAHPSYDEVGSALRLNKIFQVGLAIQDLLPPTQVDTNNPAPEKPSVGLREIAERSNANAPEGGVNCDSDPDIEIPEGEELVCEIPPDRSDEVAVITPAIVNIVKSLTDVGVMEYGVRKADGEPVSPEFVRAVQPAVSPTVNFKEHNAESFRVTYRCPALKEAKTYNFSAFVRREAGELLSAPIELVCRVPSDPPPKPPPAALAFIAAPAFAPPPPRPPDVIAEPNPNPQPQPQGQAQAQGAVASQEQEQPQLAYAAADMSVEELAGERVIEDYQMSRYRKPPAGPNPDLIFAVGAVSLAFLFGAASVTRSRVQRAHSYVHSRNRY